MIKGDNLKINNKINLMLDNLNENIEYCKNILNTEMKPKKFSKYTDYEQIIIKIIKTYISIKDNDYNCARNLNTEIIESLKTNKNNLFLFKQFKKIIELNFLLLGNIDILKDFTDILLLKDNKCQICLESNLSSLIFLNNYSDANKISNKFYIKTNNPNYLAFSLFLTTLDVFKQNNLDRSEFDWSTKLSFSKYKEDNKSKLFFIFLKKAEEKPFNDIIKLELFKIKIEMNILNKKYDEANDLILNNFEKLNFAWDLFYLNLIAYFDNKYIDGYIKIIKLRHNVESTNFLNLPHYESIIDCLNLLNLYSDEKNIKELLNLSKNNIKQIDKVTKENKIYILKNNLLWILNIYTKEKIEFNNEFETYLYEFVKNFGYSFSFFVEVEPIIIKYYDILNQIFLKILKLKDLKNKYLYEINYYKINLKLNKIPLKYDIIEEIILKLICNSEINKNKILVKGEKNKYDEYINLIFDTMIRFYIKNKDYEILYLSKVFIEFFIKKSPDNFDFKIRNTIVNDHLGYSFLNNVMFSEITAGGVQYLTNSNIFYKFYLNSLIFDDNYFDKYYYNYNDIFIQGYNSISKSIEKGNFKTIHELLFLHKSIKYNYLKMIVDLNIIENNLKNMIIKNKIINNDLNLNFLINQLNTLNNFYFTFDNKVLKFNSASDKEDCNIHLDLFENINIIFYRINILKSIIQNFYNINIDNLNKQKFSLVIFKSKARINCNVLLETNENSYCEILNIILDLISSQKKDTLLHLREKVLDFIGDSIFTNDFNISKEKLYLISNIFYYFKLILRLIKLKNKNIDKLGKFKKDIEDFINDLKLKVQVKELILPNISNNSIFKKLKQINGFEGYKDNLNKEVKEFIKILIN